MSPAIASAVQRAADKLKAKKAPSDKLNPLELAAEEFANAKTPAERAEALSSFVELVQSQKL